MVFQDRASVCWVFQDRASVCWVFQDRASVCWVFQDSATVKANKQDQICIITSTKLNNIQDLTSKALTDEKITEQRKNLN